MSSSRCSAREGAARRPANPSRLVRLGRKKASIGLVSILSLTALALPTSALADATVNLGTADSFAILAGSAVTNTGPSLINGDLGLYPGLATAVTGFSTAPSDGQVNGTIHAGDTQAQQAKADLSSAYGVAASQAPSADTAAPADIGGIQFLPGVYKYDSSVGVTGTVTLNAQGNPDAVFIFQIGSTLTTASASQISFINGAQPCHVFWQVGSSASLTADSLFVGNILASASITVGDSVTVNGRLLAGTGDVTLINDTINRADCAPPIIPPVTPPVPPITPPSPPVTGGTPGTPVTGGTPGTPVTGGTPGTPVTGGTPSPPVTGGTPGTPVRGTPATGTTGTPVGSRSTSTPSKRRAARARARARAKAHARAMARARARARATARARAGHGSPARPPSGGGGFTG